MLNFVFKAEENNANSSWGEEISQEAVQQRMEELSGAAKKLALSEELEKSQDERLDIFYDYLKVISHDQIKFFICDIGK